MRHPLHRLEAWIYTVAIFAGLPVLGVLTAAGIHWILVRASGPP